MGSESNLGVGILLEVARESAVLEKASCAMREELEKERRVEAERESVLRQKAACVERAKADRAELRAVAAEKLRQGAPVTREEAAAFRGLSTRQLQRLEDRGELVRCPGSDHPVSYPARDVLRLASADGREE
jgi:hypothetical protein